MTEDDRAKLDLIFGEVCGWPDRINGLSNRVERLLASDQEEREMLRAILDIFRKHYEAGTAGGGAR